MSQKVFLVGLPGAGKTTTGKSLGAALDWEFVDLDDLIESRSKETVAEIFKAGEDQFRLKEKEALEEAVEKNGNLIISTGGGAPCFHGNMDLMLKAGIVIFLDTDLQEIEMRIRKESHRPLMQGQDFSEKIAQLNEARRPFYQKAHITHRQNDSLSDLIEMIRK